PGQGVVAYWRPFCGEPPAGVQVLIPVLPFPGNFAPCPLCFSPSAAPSLPSEAGFDDASPALLAGLAAAAVLLSRFIRRTPPAGWWEALADLPYPRRGPYLRTLGVIGPRYGEFFTQALAEGFLPPASPALPLIVPPGLSAGELKKLKALLGRFG
ncbi:MAG: hypothetical protein LBQ61_01240, partial [Spirochaetales bacterium]|nr:hypothetical protein [Spirochaetales bacterium]